jgi:hypothetical protein
MGCGFGRMNDVTILQSTQGLAACLASTFPDLAQRGVVIGHDARHNSKRFAELAANVFLRRNVRVHLVSDICPTPFVVRRMLIIRGHGCVYPSDLVDRHFLRSRLVCFDSAVLLG